MTNLQYMKTICGGFGVTDDELTLYLTNAGMSAVADADVTQCDMILYNQFSIVLRQTLANVSEGGMNVSWNIEAVKAYYSLLCQKTGQPNILNSSPVVRDRSNIW